MPQWIHEALITYTRKHPGKKVEAKQSDGIWYISIKDKE